MTNLDSLLKGRDITLPTKACLVKAMVFPVVMYGCESWIIKKSGCQKLDAFEMWCWRSLLRVPRTIRRSIQSILNISPSNEHPVLISFRMDCCISFQSKGLSRVLSNTTVQMHQFFDGQLSLSPTLTSIHDQWKNHSLD